MNALHTPGTWTVEKLLDGRFRIVARNEGRGPLLVAEINGPYTPSFDRYAEDAALIAAAPVLLKEVEETAAWIESRALVIEALTRGGKSLVRAEAARFRGRAQLVRLVASSAKGGAA